MEDSRIEIPIEPALVKLKQFFYTKRKTTKCGLFVQIIYINYYEHSLRIKIFMVSFNFLTLQPLLANKQLMEIFQ